MTLATNGTLSGTPTAGSGGVYTLNLVANNGITPNANQTFTLTVNEAPSITSANTTTFTTGAAESFTITTGSKYPVATTLGLSGTLPAGV
ncbi:MAG: putative Ig domain-containing protein, partial [Luteolibacter sp.]